MHIISGNIRLADLARMVSYRLTRLWHMASTSEFRKRLETEHRVKQYIKKG
jgi:hypothetical protein